MFIKSLELENYRNYKELSMEFDKKTNILYGDNAQGKTNILESIYVCGTTKSHRTNKDKELISFDTDESHIRLIVEKNDISYKIDMHIKKNKPKGIALNGVPVKKASDLYGIVNCIFFSPEDLYIIKSGPSERRRFIDVIISQLDKVYLEDLINYNKVIDNRNKLLKDIQTNNSLRDTLDVWDMQLCDYGKRIIIKRNEFIKELKSISKEIHHKITGGEEKLDIEYEPNVNVDNIEQNLFLNRDRDLINRSTSIGPHRDDMMIMINGVDIRKYGSQGQQRTAALSLKLSEIELVKNKINTMPVLLLDDVLSELDSKRQTLLLESISGIQTVITCTGLDEFIKNRFDLDKIFRVESGRVFEEIKPDTGRI